jgi:glucose/arabinose dehydrogenase
VIKIATKMSGAALAACLTMTASGQTLTTQQIATGFARPVFATSPRGDFNRLFVVEQRSGSTGRVRVVSLVDNSVSSTIYLSITNVATGNEQGLLGLAFHPNFMQNGYFYVNYTRSAQSGVSAGSTIIARYRATGGDPNSLTADPTSATILLTIPQPDSNHNGGWIGFGPDGNLYIATGDGGNANDTNGTSTITAVGHTAATGNAQDITNNKLGKMLRIDVDGPDNIPGNADDADATLGLPYRTPSNNPFNGSTGDREIWAYGLRNPWRPSFDRETGDLWIADVGQNLIEEINCAPSTAAGLNYGWRCMEANSCTGLTGCTCNAASLYMPLHSYTHTLSRCSITGGYVYRGCAIPWLRGNYFFADYCGGQIYTLQKGSTYQTSTNLIDRTAELDPPGTATIVNVMSFGEDALGELYICDQTGGTIYKIVETALTAPDCNNNGKPDACDIATRRSLDLNGDGIPDECQAVPCTGDFNQDGGIDGADVEAFFIAWANGTGSADVNQDGGVDGADVEVFFVAWANGSC